MLLMEKYMKKLVLGLSIIALTALSGAFAADATQGATQVAPAPATQPQSTDGLTTPNGLSPQDHLTTPDQGAPVTDATTAQKTTKKPATNPTPTPEDTQNTSGNPNN